jgi:hypothetical protein
MKQWAAATFENVFHERDKSVSGLSHLSIKRAFRSDFVGESAADLQAHQVSADGVTYVGPDWYSGTFANRTGSFVLQQGGRRDKEGSHTFRSVALGSGTDGFEGMPFGESVLRQGRNSILHTTELTSAHPDPLMG